MLRRPFCGMAAAFLLGILLAAYGISPKLVAAALAVVLAAMGIFAWRRRTGNMPPGETTRQRLVRWRVRLRILLFVALLLFGFGRYSAQQAFREAYLPYLSDGMQISVQGRLSGKEIKYHQYIYELSSCVIGLKHPVPCNRILVYSDSDIASIGEILVFDGTVSLWKDATNEGNFDAEAFYLARKKDFQVKDITLRGVYGKASLWREGLWQLRLALKDVYQRVLSPRECGVLTTMVLGDKELLDEETRHLYQVGGLSHIMAISGLHVSVVGMTLYGFLKKRGVGFAAAGVFAGAGIYVFGTMAGMGTSVQRAVLMFFLLLIGQALGRSYDTLNALGVAALFLLWQNPYLPWDAGFQFSFVAVLGAAWVGNSVPVVKERCFAKLLEWMLPGAVIQLATLPLVAWHYFELPVYAMVVNLIVLPFTGILLAFGMAGGFAGLWWEPLAEVLLFPCQKLLELNRLLCEICEGLPGSLWVTGRPSFLRVVVYYVLLIAVTLYTYSRKRKAAIKTQGRQRVYTKSWAYVCSAILLLLLLCVPQKRDFALMVLDVGQGDGSFLRTGEGYTLFVDGGSSDVYQVGKYRILPFLKYQGVRQVDFWLVSHVDEDHVSGLREILAAGYPVRYLAFSQSVVRDEAFEGILDLAEKTGTRVLYLDAGEILHLGNAELKALFPAGNGANSDRNAASLVVWYEEDDFSGIFTGDIGSAQEAALMEQWRRDGELPGSLDFYKAAHHGSRYSNSDEFLQALHPAVSVVSCGAGNRYGHPGEEAIAHMADAGSKVYYTMESGQITLTMEHGRIAVREYLPSLE